MNDRNTSLVPKNTKKVLLETLIKSMKDAPEGGLECVDEFRKLWKSGRTAIMSATTSIQSKLVDLLIDKL